VVGYQVTGQLMLDQQSERSIASSVAAPSAPLEGCCQGFDAGPVQLQPQGRVGVSHGMDFALGHGSGKSLDVRDIEVACAGDGSLKPLKATLSRCLHRGRLRTSLQGHSE